MPAQTYHYIMVKINIICSQSTNIAQIYYVMLEIFPGSMIPWEK